MSNLQSGHSDLPSFRALRLASVVPLSVAMVVIFAVGISIITAIVVLFAVVGVGMSVQTFVVTLRVESNQSPWRARFGMLLDRLDPLGSSAGTSRYWQGPRLPLVRRSFEVWRAACIHGRL